MTREAQGLYSVRLSYGSEREPDVTHLRCPNRPKMLDDGMSGKGTRVECKDGTQSNKFSSS